ncbi:hypothetical protein BsWGS_17328 [Bradybaena similaris]
MGSLVSAELGRREDAVCFNTVSPRQRTAGSNIGSKIMTAGESWIEGRDIQIEYQELNQMIDNAVEFLCEKCEELAGRSMDVAANQLSQPSCEESNLAKKVITGTESSSAASYNQTAVSVQPAGPECYPRFTKIASGNQRKATFISQKLNFLKNQGDHLISYVGLYVTRIITAGESWVEGRDIQIEYQELNRMIDPAVEFLCEKCVELAGRSVDVVANQLSQSSFEQSNLAPQVITRTASTTATSFRQTAAPLASAATSSYNQPAVSVQPADETHLKPVLDRIADIEEAMCSFIGNAKKVAEQQSGIDQQLKELLSTLSESDKKHNSRFRKVEEQISEISDVQDAINEEHRTRLQSLERQLQKVSTAQDRLDKEVELQAELAEKLVHLPNQLEVVKENVDALDARIERIVVHFVKKNTLVDDLVDTVTTNTHTLQVISEGQAQKITMLRELKTRLKTLEPDNLRKVKDFQRVAEKVETNLRILCQMLSDRLTPLEQLRTSLNERASMRDDNINKLSKVLQDAAVMSSKLQQLELKYSGRSCGFSAQRNFLGGAPAGDISKYKIRYSNAGNQFNADSGIFTAPVDGLYVASTSLYLSENELVYVSVQYQQCVGPKCTCVCWCLAEAKQINACDVGVVGMKAGDKLFMCMSEVPKNINYSTVDFTCFLLR